MELIHGPYDTCYSSLLYDEGKGIRTLILTTIGLQVSFIYLLCMIYSFWFISRHIMYIIM